MGDNTAYSTAMCARHTSCRSCVTERNCGFFGDNNVCVPGDWLKPHGNYTGAGDSWRYFHGQCYVSTKVEFVLLPSIFGLAILAAAIIALWRYWPAQWCGLSSNDDHLSCATSDGAAEGAHDHRHSYHTAEHMPLLIDNDPGSRYIENANTGPVPMSRSNNKATLQQVEHMAGTGSVGASFEEQYGSWCQRSGNMIQTKNTTAN